MSDTTSTPTIDAHAISGDGLTYKVAKLEAAVEYVVRELADLRRSQERGFEQARNRQEHDFRLLFGMIVATNLGLASLMAKGFGWL